MAEHLQISMAAARVNAGLTQAEVAEMMEVSNKTILNWEKGKVRPRAAQLHLFCEIVGIDQNNIFLPEKET